MFKRTCRLSASAAPSLRIKSMSRMSRMSYGSSRPDLLLKKMSSLSVCHGARLSCRQLKTKLFLQTASLPNPQWPTSRTTSYIWAIAMQKWVHLALHTSTAGPAVQQLNTAVCNMYIRILHNSNSSRSRNCTSCVQKRSQLQSCVRPTLLSCLPCTRPPHSAQAAGIIEAMRCSCTMFCVR